MNTTLSETRERITYSPSFYGEKWYQRAWRPIMAFLYMALNVMDYIVRPLVNYYYVKNTDVTEILLRLQGYDPMVQIKIVESFGQVVIPPIMPEFLHVAFGAILGVAAYTRGIEKKWYAERSPLPMDDAR